MHGKIYPLREKFLTINEIYDRMLRMRFPGVRFETQKHIIYTCAEECHALLMEYWYIYDKKKETPEHEEVTMHSKLDNLEECVSCGNLTVDPETGICQECQFNNR